MKPYDNPYLAKRFPLKEYELTPYNVNHKLVQYHNLCENHQHEWKPIQKQRVIQRYEYLVYLNKQIRGRCFKKYADCPVDIHKQLGLFKEVA